MQQMSCAHVGSRFPEVLSFTFEMSMFTSGVSPKLSMLPGEDSLSCACWMLCYVLSLRERNLRSADPLRELAGPVDQAPAGIEHENTPEGYLDMGQQLARAVLQFYQMEGRLSCQ